MKKINTALFCIFVLLFCSCDVLNKAPLDEIADDSFWSDETLVKYYVNDLYSEISVDGLQLQENRSDNSVSAQRDKYRASWFKFPPTLLHWASRVETAVRVSSPPPATTTVRSIFALCSARRMRVDRER